MVISKELKDTTYIGIVEDNNDPKKIGRVKARVINIFDDIPTEDIPWSSPFKDLNGNEYNVPEVGKLITIIFDQGNPYRPEYISSEHYNINLQEKINSLSESDLKSFKSIYFDRKTQIYSNDSEGLKIDYKYNNINLKQDSVNLNLKDNNSMLNLGDETAGQQAMLGNNWLDWFDEFVENLLGSNGGPYLGNLSSPVLPNPAMISVLQKYKALREPKFLSHHVNIVDNNKISTVKGTERIDNSQLGDIWKSSVYSNLSGVDNSNFGPVDGDKLDYDPSYVAPLTDGTPDSVIPENSNPPSITNTEEFVDKLIRYMKSKSYKVYDAKNILNIVGMRNKSNGRISNKFDEKMYIFYKNNNNKWQLMEYDITTVPGYKPRTSELPNGVAVLKLGQYIDQYKIGFHQGKSDHKCLKFATSVVHRNNTKDRYNFNATTQRGSFGINIHRSSKTGSGINVNNWSQGCQVFKNINQFNQFMMLCEKQALSKKSFTYTLCDMNDFNNFS